MKKKLLTFMTILLIGILFACGSQINSDLNENNAPVEETFTGTIEEIYKKSSAVIVVETGAILNSADKVTINLNKASEESTFEVGDKVMIRYDGEVRESYPAQINTISVEKIE